MPSYVLLDGQSINAKYLWILKILDFSIIEI